MAELAPREEQSASFGTGAGRSRVDKETFGAALQSLVGRVSINVPNRLGAVQRSGRSLFRSIRSRASILMQSWKPFLL
ncbi:MAG: hypothetical protein MPW15_22930 [Candidatus Manganitrophus sp.]|nr:hypothetical protein [Candidatus Manganitrophus sp.]